ncbi:hypothetical protein AGMMS49940_07370 [Spirochaetia bacterium]|nr:hypothetical protein AGMMS49940_07370 [Spirochaetia bacterium]
MKNLCFVVVLSLSCMGFVFAQESEIIINLTGVYNDKQWAGANIDGVNVSIRTGPIKVKNGRHTVKLLASRNSSGAKTNETTLTIDSYYDTQEISFRVGSSHTPVDIDIKKTKSLYDAFEEALKKQDYNTARKIMFEMSMDLNKRYANNNTLLIQTAKKSSIDINVVRSLVELGANVNLRNEAGETAASIAYDKGEIEVYNYLKEHGAIDFAPKQVTAPAQSSTTNVYVESAPSSSSGSSGNSASRPTPPSRIFNVSVYYVENGTKKSMPFMESAANASEAERQAERKWKTVNGARAGVVFIEAIAN